MIQSVFFNIYLKASNFLKKMSEDKFNFLKKRMALLFEDNEKMPLDFLTVRYVCP